MQVITERFSVIFRLFFVNADDCQHYLDDGHGHDGQDSRTHDGVLNLCHIYPVVDLTNHIVVIRLTSHISFTDYTFFFVLCFLWGKKTYLFHYCKEGYLFQINILRSDIKT